MTLLAILTFLLAQAAQPTAPADPHVYTDPAMSYTAPDTALLVNRQYVSLEQLSEDLQPVAAWILDPGKENARQITLSMEAYSGPPDQWEAQFESQTHSSGDGVLIQI